jgi:ribonuclease HIII
MLLATLYSAYITTLCMQTTCDSLKPGNRYYHRSMTSKTHVNSSGCMEFKASLSRREEASATGDFSVVVGIDEAGRGPLCGPVVAAACIVLQDEYPDNEGIIDSKKLTDEDQRERTYEKLVSDKRVMWCACIVTNHEIDSINILQASLAAMRRATEGLFEKYHLTDTSKFVALIDGNKIPENMPIASKAIIKVINLFCSRD